MINEVFWLSQSVDRDKIPNNEFSDLNLWIPFQGLQECKKGKYIHCGELVKHWAIIYVAVGKSNIIGWVFFGEDKTVIGGCTYEEDELEETLTDIRKDIELMFNALTLKNRVLKYF